MYCSTIGLEAPYQLAKTERKGGRLKDIASKVVENKSVKGIQKIRRLAAEVNSVVNEMSRTGGFSTVEVFHDMLQAKEVQKRQRDRLDVFQLMWTVVQFSQKECHTDMKQEGICACR